MTFSINTTQVDIRTYHIMRVENKQAFLVKRHGRDWAIVEVKTGQYLKLVPSISEAKKQLQLSYFTDAA